jgi:hypothetical protein
MAFIMNISSEFSPSHGQNRTLAQQEARKAKSGGKGGNSDFEKLGPAPEAENNVSDEHSLPLHCEHGSPNDVEPPYPVFFPRD